MISIMLNMNIIIIIVMHSIITIKGEDEVPEGAPDGPAQGHAGV